MPLVVAFIAAAAEAAKKKNLHCKTCSHLDIEHKESAYYFGVSSSGARACQYTTCGCSALDLEDMSLARPHDATYKRKE